MKKILVVDDDSFIRQLLCSALRKAGFEVTEASNGNEALQCMKRENPDLVITDILMPDKEGIETIIELQTIKPDIKIIAMSGGGSSKNMLFLDMAKQVGAKLVLKKPFKPSELMEAVNTVLSS